MNRAARRSVGALVGALVVALVGFSVWSEVAHHQWPWQSLPDSVQVCGQNFELLGGNGPVHAGPYTRAELASDGSTRLDSWWNLEGHFEVWAGGHCGTDLGTEVFVRAPSGFFYGYVAPSN